MYLDPFPDPYWDGKAYRILAGSPSNAYNEYESGPGAKHMLSSIDRVTCSSQWPGSYQPLTFDRLVKMSILAQLHALAPPGIQKRVVAWVGAFVFLFMLFTVFVSICPVLLNQYPLTHHKGCNLSVYSDACCLGP
jgi:hypothetical protein